MADEETRKEINRLYWESDESVSEIGDRLDISRRALYEGIEPLPAGAPCPECGAGLGYRNRTSAENREAECAECGREVQLAADVDGPEPQVEQERSAASLSPTPTVHGAHGPALGFTLLCGIALGAGLGYLVRRG